ncbi:MAG: alanine--tRNA ligase, partial [Eudoraea sp.]|nr:alanine--tRNA ligase [Eudoraea sp.]
AVHSRYLRFDFSHFSKMTDEELLQVEQFVNERIQENLPLHEHRNIPMQEAMEDGAMALFGEKYGDEVRTIRFGDSIELCGGTHVARTGDIWHFKISSESAIAAGIRRIEAITSDAARAFYEESYKDLEEIKSSFKGGKPALESVKSMQEENLSLKKQIEVLLREKAGNLKQNLLQELETVNGVAFLARKVGLDAGGMKDLAFEMGSQRDDLFLLLGAEKDGKALLACYISKPLVEAKGLHAGTIVRELGKHIQGGGGGQPFFATAGGKNPNGIPEALEAAKDYLSA